MGKASKLRDCPAIGRAIKPMECGQNRGLNYPCPPECPYCPWGYENYASLRNIDQKIDREAFRYFRDLVGGSRAYDTLTADGVDDGVAFYDRQFRALHRDPVVDGLTAFAHWEASGWKGLSGDEIFVAGLHKCLRMEVLEIVAVLDDQQTECRFALRPGSERLIVRDISLAKVALRGSVMVGRVIPYPHFYVMHGISVPFAPGPGESAAEALQGISRSLGGPDPLDEAFLPWLDEHFAEAAEEIQDMADDRRRTIFENSDLNQCVAIYKLRTIRKAMEDKIAGYPEISVRDPEQDEEEIEGSPAFFDWLRDGRSREWESALPPAMRSAEGDFGSKIWGSLRLFDDRLEIESFGRLRYEPMCEMVEEFFGDDVEFEREVVVDLGRQARDGGGSPIGQRARSQQDHEIPHEVKVAMLEQTFRSHYQKFLSEPVPALKGLTPREAARDRALRPRLVELMKQHLQTIDSHSRREGHPFSIDWVLDELGLEELKPTHGLPVRPVPKKSWPPIPQKHLDTYWEQIFSGKCETEIPDFVFDLVESMPRDEIKNHEADFMLQMLGLICLIYTRDQGARPATTAEEIVKDVAETSLAQLSAAERKGLDAASFFEQLAQRSPQPALADAIFKLVVATSMDKRERKHLGISDLRGKPIRESMSSIIILNCAALIHILSREA